MLIAVLSSCKKDNEEKYNPDNNGSDNPKVTTGVIIKGRLPNKSRESDSLSLGDARKVLVFKGPRADMRTLLYDIVDIVDGAFADTVDMGQCLALVFMDENFHYIGTLSSHGIRLLPLGHLKNPTLTVIDLSTLTMVGDIVIPSHDPFGDEIIITEAEINSLKEIDAFFESIAKNIDADNNGELDLLSNRQLFIQSFFTIREGKWGTDTTAPVLYDSSVYYIDYGFAVYSGNGFTLPSSVILSGPADNPSTDITTTFVQPNAGGGFQAGMYRPHELIMCPTNSSLATQTLPFEKGVYTLKIDGISGWSIYFSSIDAKSNLMIVIPTLHTNSDGDLVSVSLEYKYPDNATVVNPENIIIMLGVQLSNSNRQEICHTPWMSKYPLMTGETATGLYNYTFPTPVDISALYNVGVGYFDQLGNSYCVDFRE